MNEKHSLQTYNREVIVLFFIFNTEQLIVTTKNGSLCLLENFKLTLQTIQKKVYLVQLYADDDPLIHTADSQFLMLFRDVKSIRRSDF